MRSPKDMGIIEIDVTNACVHQCANCTRFCGHHAKPFFMSFDMFKRAVDSLEGFPGMAGVIGGEPTLHPEFERFADYIREKRTGDKLNLSCGPISDMQFHINTTVDKGTSKAVLLSSLSTSYYKNFEAINDTFAFQLLNDHTSNSLHQALLMSRKELPIPDDEWRKKRDACWIQNTWSATITPKGAFFCEVAGSLDMLLNGPGGWPVEPGWWKREPKDFADQLHWCEMCSGCLDVPKRLSHDERDDVTPRMYERLKELKSPKVMDNRVIIRNPADYESYKDPAYQNGSEYIKAGEYIRMSSENTSLLPKDIRFCYQSEWREFIKEEKPKDWLVVTKDDATDKDREKIRIFMADKIWNPGCVYKIDDSVTAFNINARSIRDAISFPSSLNKDSASYYVAEKNIIVESDDPLLCILGGDSKLVRERGARKGKKVLIYGAGNIGKEVIKELKKNGFDDFDVVVSKKESADEEVLGYKIHEIDEYSEMATDVIVIIAVASWLYDEILYELNLRGIKNYRYLV